MLTALVEVLRRHPEVTFFLVLGLGYLLGKLKLGGFTLGAVTGTLLAGVAVGQLGLEVSSEVKQAFFLLFLFSIGFRTGPQFFRGLRSDGLQQAALSVVVAVTGLAVVSGARDDVGPANMLPRLSVCLRGWCSVLLRRGYTSHAAAATEPATIRNQRVASLEGCTLTAAIPSVRSTVHLAEPFSRVNHQRR